MDSASRLLFYPGNSRGPGKTLLNSGCHRNDERVTELLTQQFEAAKIDEARDAALIQVMDKAIEPERKSKPKRSLIVILTALVAGFLAIIWAFIREAGQRARQNPEQASRLDTLRGYLHWSNKSVK